MPYAYWEIYFQCRLFIFFRIDCLNGEKIRKVIGKFFGFCIEKGKSAGRKLQDTAGRGLFIALVLFIGIPIPGTGAWTGILAASILRMDFKKSIMACLCGIMLAGVIIAISSIGVLNLLDIN